MHVNWTVDKILSYQVNNNYSNDVKNRRVQFDSLTISISVHTPKLNIWSSQDFISHSMESWRKEI